MALAIAPIPPPFHNLPGTIGSYNRMHRLLTLPNEHNNIAQLKQIHAQVLRTGHPQSLFLFSRILHFSSSLNLHYAFRLFEQIVNPNSFMWNTMIKACSRSIDSKEYAILLYFKMLQQETLTPLPDNRTYPFVLKACAYLFALIEGQQIQAHIMKLGLDSDVYINNSLIHLYASCGCLEQATKVFDQMPARSLVSLNVMIDTLVQFGQFEKALVQFHEIQRGFFEPDGYTMQSIISACAGLNALSLGMWAHAYVLRNCDVSISHDVLVNSCLLDMYCKCGSLDFAQQLFERMPRRDITSYNSMILGFALHGKAKASIEYFEQMIRTESFTPNSITFIGLLSACNHRGMVDEGRKYFEMMVKDCHIKPQLEHYGGMVNLLSRNGLIDEALDFVCNMPMRPDPVIWRCLLDACWKKNASITLSEEVARQVLESGGHTCSGVYVLLSRVYASAKRWDDVGLVRKLMTDKGITKEPGCSSIEIDGVNHEFFAGDTSHPQTKQIYRVLDVIEGRLESVGYRPDFSEATMVDEINDGRKNWLRLHSERLAIAFGLLSMKERMPIRVFKNLRVCNDCHEVAKLISRVFNVEIIVRDRARFHHFKDGSCSCMDYW